MLFFYIGRGFKLSRTQNICHWMMLFWKRWGLTLQSYFILQEGRVSYMDFNLGLPWEVVKLKFMLCLISYDEFYIHAFYILPRFFFFFFFSLSFIRSGLFFVGTGSLLFGPVWSQGEFLTGILGLGLFFGTGSLCLMGRISKGN